MTVRVFVVAIIMGCAGALASSISWQKVFSQNPASPQVKSLPPGFTIPPEDVPCILPEPNHDIAQITGGPELEIVNDTLAIIRWTTTNPGGTDLHYGIVHHAPTPRTCRRSPSLPAFPT